MLNEGRQGLSLGRVSLSPVMTQDNMCQNRNIYQNQINIFLEGLKSFASMVFDLLVRWLMVNDSDYYSLSLGLLAEPQGPV